MRNIKVVWLVLTFLPILLLILGYLYPTEFFSNQEIIKEYVNSFGVIAPIIFILIQITQVVITPFSHYAVSIAGGYIFGLWEGFLYNWIGRVLGTFIAFYLGRYFGRKIIERVVKKKTLEKYDKIFNKSGVLLFLAYFLPLFPDDELSYLAGMSKMKASLFIPIMILGHIGGSLGLAYLGSGIPSMQDPIFIAISLVTLIGGILFVLFFKQINNNSVN